MSSIRICKAIARATGISRRTAEKLVQDKRVLLNGQIVSNPATHVDIDPLTLSDDLWVSGARVDLSKAMANSGAPDGQTRLWILHKLRQELVTDYDPEGRPTVYQRIASMMGEDQFRVLGMKSVGRLDFMSEGLLLLTNDGVLKRHLEMPSTGLERKYKVEARGGLNTKWLDYLGRGAKIENKKFRPIGVEVLRTSGKNHLLNVTLTEGKTREIRKAFAAGGLSVHKLKRIGYGPYTLGPLEKGSLREIKLHRSHLKVIGGPSEKITRKRKSSNDTRRGVAARREYHTSATRRDEECVYAGVPPSLGSFVSDSQKVLVSLRDLNLTNMNDIASEIPGIEFEMMDSTFEPRPELLCLDVGTRRTGVALSNIALGVATPMTVLHHPDPYKSTAEEMLGSLREHIDVLNDLSDRHNVVAIVVGWPLEITGVPGPQCGIVKEYCRILLEQAEVMEEEEEEEEEEDKMRRSLHRLDMLTWDERWSTEAVRNNERHDGTRDKKRKFRRSEIGKSFDEEEGGTVSTVDDLAATYILQGVLAWLRKDEYERDLEGLDDLNQFRPSIRTWM